MYIETERGKQKERMGYIISTLRVCVQGMWMFILLFQQLSYSLCVIPNEMLQNTKQPWLSPHLQTGPKSDPWA